MPANPASLTAAAFARPAVIWPEEPNCPAGTPSSPTARCGAFNQGAYVAVARGGAEYVSWERNLDSNTVNGDPYVYIHAARLAAGARTPSIGAPGDPVILTKGQPNGNSAGGVKGLNNTFISATSISAPHPRRSQRSTHPEGERRHSFALHFLPAVSVRTDGTICTSWYDRRRNGPTSTLTDYFADCRTAAGTNSADKRITTGSTDWAGTSSAINPNFGDYTDSATDGTRTYYTWSDGRLGIPQPFVDHS